VRDIDMRAFLRHVFTETRQSIARNSTAFAMATSVQSVCLILLGVFFLVAFNLGIVVRSTSRYIELHVFLTEGADAGAVEDQLRCITGIAGTRFVSKEEALTELKTELGEDSSIVDVLGSNPLPSSVRATLAPGAASADGLKDLQAKIGLLPGVAEVWSGQESLARLARVMRVSIWLGIGLLVVVSLAVAFIVFQTVDTSIASRRQEIEIMELVGATRSAVRTPFLLEGVLQGLLGGLCASLVVLLFARVAALVLPEPVVPVGALFALNLGLGCMLGLVGSTLALGRIRK